MCDGMHDLRTCPWLQGMPEAMREELGRAYKMFQIVEKDKVLRRWLEIRRYAHRALLCTLYALCQHSASLIQRNAQALLGLDAYSVCTALVA